MAADICRLCLRPIDKAKSIDLVAETTKFAMLKELLPEMNLDITENTQVCSNCMQELEVSYNFKQSVVVNEANIQTKLEENKLKKIDLKLMLDDVAKKELKEDDYVCRTCLLICRTPSIHLFDTPSNMMPCSFVKKMCQLVFELEFIASDKPVLCDECWETLQTVYNFRKCCLKTDKKLRTYVAKKNLKKLGVEEFKKFVEENPPIDNDEVSSDDELDGYIKEEPIDEEELKFDPEEASCSSASLKFKEETTVKSESDEDMEDEPELLDPKALKSETSELDGEDCKMEIGDVKVDAEGEGAAGPSGRNSTNSSTHMKTEFVMESRKTLKCSECSYSTNIGIKMQMHELVHKAEFEINWFRCTQCPYTTKYKYDFRKHFKNHFTTPKNIYECTLCTYTTVDQEQFKNHSFLHTPEDELFMCPKCSTTFKNKYSLERHFGALKSEIDNEKMFSCSKCSFETSYKCEFNKHHEIHKTWMFHCSYCSFKTNIRKSFKQHKLIHKRDTNEPKCFKCSRCSFTCDRSGKLKEHLLIHKNPEEVEWFSCGQCPYKSIRKDLLLKHFYRHLGDHQVNIFRCTQCSYSTRYKSSLKAHMLIHDPVEQRSKFECPRCFTKFKYKRSFRDHISKAKSGDETRWFTCDQCSYKAEYKCSLQQHRYNHTKAKFQCSHCPYKSNRSGNLKVHELKHKPITERTLFKCDQCANKYVRKYTLNMHIIREHFSSGKSSEKNSSEKNS